MNFPESSQPKVSVSPYVEKIGYLVGAQPSTNKWPSLSMIQFQQGGHAAE